MSEKQPRLRYFVHPCIHPEDAAAAIFARLRTRRRRRGVDEHRIIEDSFIADLANQPWSMEQISQLQKSSEDRDFRERFAHALEKGRKPLFDKYDVLILINWRKLRIRTATMPIDGIPGLRDWSPKAVAGLFEGTDMDCFLDAAWYTARRKRLGLKGRLPYRIKNFPIAPR